MRICPNDKFIEDHYFEDPFYNFFALNLLFQDTSYSLALKYSSFLFKFFSFAFCNTNFWFKISKICPKISHCSQISHYRENTGYSSKSMHISQKTRPNLDSAPQIIPKNTLTRFNLCINWLRMKKNNNFDVPKK